VKEARLTNTSILCFLPYVESAGDTKVKWGLLRKWKRKGGGRKIRNVIEGKVHYIHVCKDHDEPPYSARSIYTNAFAKKLQGWDSRSPCWGIREGTEGSMSRDSTEAPHPTHIPGPAHLFHSPIPFRSLIMNQ
jgi:hypothetical protein